MNLIKELSRHDISIEVVAMIIFLVGMLMNHLDTPNNQYFLLIGGGLLIAVYVLRFYSPARLTDKASPGDLFVYKLTQGSQALILAGIGLLAYTPQGRMILILGLINIGALLLFMIYFRIKNMSIYPWGRIYFFRLVLIAGLGIYALLHGINLAAMNIS